MIEIEADLYLNQFLGIGVIGFIALRRIVADSIEALRAAAIVDHAATQGPALIAQASELVFAIEAPFDPLLDPRLGRPLFVGRCILVNAAIDAVAEIRVVQNVRGDDPADLVVVVGLQPDRQKTQRRTAVRIRPDQRHGNEGCRRGVEPPGQSRRRQLRSRAAGVGGRMVVRHAIGASQRQSHAQDSGTAKPVQRARNQPVISPPHYAPWESLQRSTVPADRRRRMSDFPWWKCEIPCRTMPPVRHRSRILAP